MIFFFFFSWEIICVLDPICGNRAQAGREGWVGLQGQGNFVPQFLWQLGNTRNGSAVTSAVTVVCR